MKMMWRRGDINSSLGRLGRVGGKQKQPGKSAYEAWMAASMADLKEFAGVVPLSKREPPSKKGEPPQKASIKLLEHVRKHCPEREASTQEWLQARGLLPKESSS
jgi:hypothetical protein